MNRFYFFMIIFIAQPLCVAMEKKHNILTELTIAQNPCFAQYLTDDRVVIVSETRDFYNYTKPSTIIDCKTVNPKNNQVIKQVFNGAYDFCSTYLTVHPNKQKFALSFANQITVYNAETGEKEWLQCIGDYKTVIKSHVFSPMNNTIFVTYERKGSRQISEYNYATDTYNYIDTRQYLLPDIALHPTEGVMCGGTKKEGTFFYSLGILKRLDRFYKARNIPCDATHYQYNHDGSFIAAYRQYTKDLYIITPPPIKDYNNPCSMYLNELTPQEFAKSKYCACCGIRLETTNGYPHNRLVRSWDIKTEKNKFSRILKMLFYPQSSIVVILKEDDNDKSIEYIDTQLQKRIHVLKLEKPTNQGHSNNYDTYDLSFSPDKTKLLVTYDDKCIILSVHWQINKPYYPYLILKNYQFDGQELPNDIIRILIDTLFPNI